MKTIFIFLCSSFILQSCMSTKKLQPRYSLDEIEFKIEPRIVKRSNHYYLQYQINIPDTSQIMNRIHVLAAKKNGKGFYYFGGKLSFRELGNLNERLLELDGFHEYAEKDSVYWLNSDGTEVKLNIFYTDSID